MVNASLTGTHPLRNNGGDVSRLANLFHILFEHYTSHSTPMAADFIQELRTLAGLGFTSCLADEISTTCYRPYLNDFLRYDRGDFQKHRGALMFLSLMMANMVVLAIDSFRVRHCPTYYPGFINILKRILYDVEITESDQSREAQQVFELLQRRLR